MTQIADDAQPSFRRNPSDLDVRARLAFLVDVFQSFLDGAREGQFVIVIDDDAPDQFIQFKLNHGVLYGEVGSREWDKPEHRRPFDAVAKVRLAAEGFTHGGPERNYICDNLAQSPPYLADLYGRLYEIAYGMLPPVLPEVASDVLGVRSVAADRGRSPSRARPVTPEAERHWTLRHSPIHAAAGLKHRTERALRSNFAEVGANLEDLEAVRGAAEHAGTWQALPEWAKEWIEKAEEGPLWVPLDSGSGREE